MGNILGIALTGAPLKIGGGANRAAVVKSYNPAQYLRLLESTGTTAVDASGNARNGTYQATSVPAMLAQMAGPFGGLVPQFLSTNASYINAYTASLGAAVSGAEGAAVIFAKFDPSIMADGLQHYQWHERASATYYNAFQKWSTNYQVRYRHFTNGTDVSLTFLINSPLWMCLGADWSESGGYANFYVNGLLRATAAIAGPFVGSVSASRLGRDISTSLFHAGGLAEHIRFTAPIGAAAHLALAGEYGNRTLFLAYGDSKTDSKTYQFTTTGLLEAGGNKWDYRTLARSGYTVATMQDEIDTDLAAYTSVAPRYVLTNLGANDVVSLPTEAAWKADYQYIFSAMRAKWPNVNIYIMRPWQRGYAANCNTLATWIGDLVTANPGVCFLGPDERVFLENGDDGVTYTSDGIHPNTAGYALTGQQWAGVLPG